MHPALPRPRRAMALFGTASFLTVAGTLAAQAGAAPPAARPVEEVIITGSLIRGAPAVGVPVTALSQEDFQENGALTVADVLKEVPSLVVQTSNVGTPGQTGTVTRPQQVLIRGVPKETLMMINGMRFPFQNFSTCYVDPSIIPQLAVAHIDVLADGASATYGSDAVTGVINVVLKRGYDGAISQGRFATSSEIGNASYQATQLYGTTWNGGGVTLTYEWYHEDKVSGIPRPYFTFNYEPYGYDDVTPIGAAMPGVVSTGALSTNPALAAQGFSAAVGSRACANCFSIPAGTGWNYGDTPAHTNPINPGSAPTTTWTMLLANPGVTTLRNPYEVTDILPNQDRNAATITFDQHLFGVVSVFGDAFYSNRRAVQFATPGAAPAAAQTLSAVTVPTTNPYYPSGAPAGLRVSYDLALEHNTRVNSGEIASRYDFGFEANLPYEWRGRLFYAMSSDQIFDHDTGNVNINMVNAALGNTVASVAANGATPGQAAFTKPANVPYLNLFCDATRYQCNSPTTLSYIGAYRLQEQHWQIVETGLNLDGPVIELPGGMLRAALGANAVSHHYLRDEHSNFSTVNTAVILLNPQPEARRVWAVFGQVNVPVVGEKNGIPLLRSFEVEAALRYDHYEFQSVTTPKLAATWNLGYGFAIRGTWGKSFRAPVFSEFTATGGLMIQPVNTAAGAASNTVTLSCPTVPGQPNAANAANPGSLNAYLNPTCSNNAATLIPAGIRLSGGSGAALDAGVRTGQVLGPENAKNWAIGFNFAPTDFLAGLDLDATWYHVIINNLIGGNTGGLNVNDPLAVTCTAPTPGCIYMVRSNPNLPITDPVNASFLAIVNTLLGNSHSTVQTTASSIQFINDAAITNLGYRQLSGIDFSARYDIDLGDWGAWNVGMDGNYKAQDKIKPVLSGPVSNNFQLLGSSVPIGNNTGGLLKYRGRVGWNGAGWADGLSVTAFVNFIPHSANWAQIATTYVPPRCFWAAGFSAGSCYPGSPYWGPYSIFPNSVPSQYIFDVSLGYQTGTMPANPYLQNVNFQLTVLNVLNRKAPFVYALEGSRTFPGVQTVPPDQRYVSFAVTKAW